MVAIIIDDGRMVMCIGVFDVLVITVYLFRFIALFFLILVLTWG